jgi:hypothetical protein
MTGATTRAILQPPPMTADRSGWLTDVICAPGESAIRAADCDALRRSLCEAVGGTTSPVTVDGLLRAFPRQKGAWPRGARWSVRGASRSVGLAAVGRCARGTADTPAEGVADALRGLLDDAARGLAGSGSLGAWLARLRPGALAALRADAVTWAIRLWLALDWDRIGRGAVFDWRDQWWDCPSAPVALRGRAEVRLRNPGAHLTVRGGWPGPAADIELGVSALVSTLAASAPPLRVAGWWPECGRMLVVDVRRSLLERTVASVATAVKGAGVARPEVIQSGRR